MLEKSLPSEYYLSSEIFAQERERIFSREWFCAGRADQLPEPGDVRVRDLLGESVLLTRTREGKLAAHYNVCRHRGARLCVTDAAAGECGPARGGLSAGGASGARTTPGPMAWTDASSALLSSTRTRPCARTTSRSTRSGSPLWGGFFFLNLWPAGPPARDFAGHLGPIPERVAPLSP